MIGGSAVLMREECRAWSPGREACHTLPTKTESELERIQTSQPHKYKDPKQPNLLLTPLLPKGRKMTAILTSYLYNVTIYFGKDKLSSPWIKPMYRLQLLLLTNPTIPTSPRSPSSPPCSKYIFFQRRFFSLLSSYLQNHLLFLLMEPLSQVGFCAYLCPAFASPRLLTGFSQSPSG